MLRLGDFDLETRVAGSDEVHVRLIGTLTDDDVHAVLHQFESGARGRYRRRIWDLRSAELLDPERSKHTIGLHASTDPAPRHVAFVTEDPIFQEIARMLCSIRPEDRFGAFPDMASAEMWVRQI